MNWLFDFVASGQFSNPMGIVFVLVLIFAIVVFIFFAVKRQTKRDQKTLVSLEQFAADEKMHFSVEVNQGVAKFVQDYGVGSLYEPSAMVRHVFWAEYRDVLWFRAFEYYYLVPSSNGATTLRFLVAQLDLPFHVPDLQVREEDVFSRIGTAFGKQDIVVGSKAFDRRFRVRGDDEEAIRAFLNEDVRAWMMKNDYPAFEAKGHRVMIFKGGEMTKEFVLESRNLLLEFWDVLPKDMKEGVN